MSDKLFWILIDFCNLAVHNKLILVLLKPCYFQYSPHPSLKNHCHHHYSSFSGRKFGPTFYSPLFASPSYTNASTSINTSFLIAWHWPLHLLVHCFNLGQGPYDDHHHFTLRGIDTEKRLTAVRGMGWGLGEKGEGIKQQRKLIDTDNLFQEGKGGGGM